MIQRTDQQLTKRNLEDKKMKKRNVKKNNSKKSPKYGLNVYGERCIVKEITIQKDTANEQCIAIVDDIYAHERRGVKLEYTVYYSKELTLKEAEAIAARMKFFLDLRTQMGGRFFNKAS